MQKFDMPYCEEYSHSLEFKTSVVRRFDGSEQRQALWMNPKRSFSFNFESSPVAKSALEGFFKGLKGDFTSFYWRWDEFHCGSNLDYVCFLDSSKMSSSILQFSYSKTPLILSTLDDGNVLKGRFFLDNKFWSFSGAIEISAQKVRYQGISSLFQRKVLIPGQRYILVVKTANLQGLPPVLSSATAELDGLQKSFFEGVKKLDFVALGEDLIIETSSGSSGEILEISLLPSVENQAVLDFQPNIEHQSEIIFSTIKNENFTFSDSRQLLCEKPVRRWVLAFEFTPFEAVRFEAFFRSKLGRYKAFDWIYDGENIKVRFDTDKLDQKQYPLGYREVKIPIIEVLQ